jgi:predicted TIM-barrel fold metal-dependent hydrolase
VVPAARTDEEAIEAYLADMERYNIVLAVGSVEDLDLLNKWTVASSGRILEGLLFPEYIIPGTNTSTVEWPDIDSLRAEFQSGNLAVMGEITAQYGGIAANDPRLEPYFALAEELDIPVCIHCGTGPPGAPYGSEPELRAALGYPLFLEDVLVRHPKLRIYIAHAGHPFLAETKALMYLYPNVYADISVLNWVIPREEFYWYLKSLMRSGLGKRLMYGSDQMIWPDAVGMSIESIESADFLTEEQKRDIFYNNAVRFLRLDERTINQ